MVCVSSCYYTIEGLLTLAIVGHSVALHACHGSFYVVLTCLMCALVKVMCVCVCVPKVKVKLVLCLISSLVCNSCSFLVGRCQY
jgi:hypothetical protein